MNPLLRRLSYELKTQKRKAGTLAVLAVAGLLLWGKLLIPTGTQQASGQDPVVAQPDEEAGDGEREPIPEPPNPRIVRVEVRDSVQRDPFRIHRDRYESAEPEPTKPEETQEDERRQRRRAIRAEAERLTLQSTLIGQQPQAIINGRPVAPGQTINGFRVLEVESRAVRLVKQDVRITLRIRSD